MTNPYNPASLILRILRPAAGFAIAIAIAFLSLLGASPSAQAQTYSVLYSFTGEHGVEPFSGLLRDSAGNLYGTTVYGGNTGDGTIFKLDTAGAETVLYNFKGNGDGENPLAGLIQDASGTFYGTTCCSSTNSGNVFKLEQSGETVLHQFIAFKGGAQPTGVLVRDTAGNLYGTTEYGGNLRPCLLSGCGLVFKLDPTGKETVLYHFKGKADGRNPVGSLIRDSAGNLYGTTIKGGAAHAGVVFKLDRAGKQTILYSFKGTTDGKSPFAGVIRDAAGNLYGTTQIGGAAHAGVVFKLDAAGTQTILHSFKGSPDGANPIAGLIRDPAGNLYGTTNTGGSSGHGTVFKLDSTNKLTVLHSFKDTDGAFPVAGLIQDANSNLYGTTASGGKFGFGVVFKLTP